MFAVGHIALGYVLGKILGKVTDGTQVISVIWTLSLLPDIDILIPGLRHRGPTHSLILVFIIFAPFLLTRIKRTIPYFAALASHSVIGDYMTGGGIQLFWPVSSEWVHNESAMRMGGASETYVELALFAVLIITLTLSRDYRHFFRSDVKNTILFIPLLTIILPLLFEFPIKIPKNLILPHLFVLTIMVTSFSISLVQISTARSKKPLTPYQERSGIMIASTIE